MEERKKTQLELRCGVLNTLFKMLESTSSRVMKQAYIDNFKTKHPQVVKDLDYCFEVLAGKHKLGYTYEMYVSIPENLSNGNLKVRELVEVLKELPPTDDNKMIACAITPLTCRNFIRKLVNREFKLGYSNKDAMVKVYSPMLAKKYQDIFVEKMYYVQEKLDGNRCIACYNNELEKWEFWSRSGKQLNVEFDMSWARTEDIFDGEVMTLEHAGSRDFNRTSGAINGKYTDKSGLYYFIYDIIKEDKPYSTRKRILDTYEGEKFEQMTNTRILPVLGLVHVYPNHDYNWQLDEYLDMITDKGGEGVMLRDPDALYECGKRSNGLLKYKKTQTMDLRIIGWNEGNGKYEGAIGSFVCATDDKDIIVNVSGMPDSIHYSDPEDWIGKIIEVAYFDISVNSTTHQKSLRFPRLKKVRDDKNETSIY